MNPTFVPFPAGTVLWVALGGAIGAALRFMISEVFRRGLTPNGIPWGTLVINTLGSLVLGYFTRWAVTHDATPQVRAFVAIGVCGGFTTFSAFALEHFALLQAGEYVRAATYTLLSLLLTFGAIGLGYALARS
jgi:fluoride exporter